MKTSTHLDLLLFLTFSVLVTNQKKLLDTVANPSPRGLLNREKIIKEKSLAYMISLLSCRDRLDC